MKNLYLLILLIINKKIRNKNRFSKKEFKTLEKPKKFVDVNDVLKL